MVLTITAIPELITLVDQHLGQIKQVKNPVHASGRQHRLHHSHHLSCKHNKASLQDTECQMCGPRPSNVQNVDGAHIRISIKVQPLISSAPYVIAECIS